jgi:hypothetical protein
MQTDLLAVLLFGKSRVIVTGQTLLVAHLGSGFRLAGRRSKRREQQKKCYEPTATLHGIPRFQQSHNYSKSLMDGPRGSECTHEGA